MSLAKRLGGDGNRGNGSAARARSGLGVLCALLALAGCDGAAGTDAGTPVADAARADQGATGGDASLPDLGATDSGTPGDTGTQGDTGTPGDSGISADAGTATARTAVTNGSTTALTADERVLVVAHRQANVISVHAVSADTTPVVGAATQLAVANAEPWSVVIGNDDDTAYVILRNDQRVARIRNLKTAPTLDTARVQTGSEPTGLAISPTGATLYVANWAEGTVTEIDVAGFSVRRTIDLNAALVSTGTLGTVTGRAALAHPRAIVVTNDGDTDDADETVYVTEYFSAARTSGVPADLSRFDVGRQGFVYRIAAGTGAVGAPISIAPTTDTGFVDSNGATTGCFPNQLQVAALNSGKLYVMGLCESPRGPTGPILDPATNLATNTANFKTQIHTAVYVIDTATNAELPAEGSLLTTRWQQRYDAMSVADDATRRMPLIPTDLAFVPQSTIAYFTSYGSDAVFRLTWPTAGMPPAVGSSRNNFIDLTSAAQLPTGVAVVAARMHLIVASETTRNVSVVSLGTQAAIAQVLSATLPTAGSPEEHVLKGRRFFVTGLGRWSFKGQAWNSCETCHGDGLTDDVTWFFGRGPRQSTSLDGTYDSQDRAQRRVLNWTAIFDEVADFELNTRGNSGGVGAIVHATAAPIGNGQRIHFDGTTPVPTGAMATAMNNWASTAPRAASCPTAPTRSRACSTTST